MARPSAVELAAVLLLPPEVLTGGRDSGLDAIFLQSFANDIASRLVLAVDIDDVM